jgi:putative membrane protein
MLARYLAHAAFAGLVLTAAVGPTQAVAQQAAVATDSSFILMAGSLGLLQMKLGKLAQEKGSSASVRDFGKRMVADYTKANEEFAAGAKQAAYPAPVLLREHRQAYDRVAGANRDSFDKKYMAEMVAKYGDAVRLFQQEADAGRVTSLKQLAANMLPTIQQHMTLATQTAGAVGADVTATAGGERKGS